MEHTAISPSKSMHVYVLYQFWKWQNLAMAAVDKKEWNFKIVDFAVSGGRRIEEKKKDKTEKYQGLGRELQTMWNLTVKIIPLVVGSLGAIPKQFHNRLKQIGVTAGTAQVQKKVLLRTTRTLRKVFEM